MLSTELQFTVVVPAAGVGKRMAADRPKQYLTIDGKTVLEHTLDKLISHPNIQHIVVAVHPQDPYFDGLPCRQQPWLTRVDGGDERADSVLAGLNMLAQQQQPDWVLVHDAARPCVSHSEISQLLALAEHQGQGGLLACPVRDTMKRANKDQPSLIDKTVDRDGLWHALTPQFFPFSALRTALSNALQAKIAITDEASAMEWAGHPVQLVESSDKNIKITRPDDLALAAFYLSLENL
ncbi:2-C-methyl-D-erythritol 4-phosphate cytidylyltransferase [Aliiglaciecola litoralis]|uniref:2-C-methyl-D-erythritol 4-phosphate cytidylyltransferase n=1 Tax=Aliiglaciecola litoralis TaxID=582857 RepID=A0ABP3WRR5_9ALTE